jgi:hypothetical protein
VSYFQSLVDPLSLIDINADRVDVLFDRFHLRDAKLPNVLGTALITRLNLSGIKPEDVISALWDTAARWFMGFP